MKQTSKEKPQTVTVSAGNKKWYLTVNAVIKETEEGYEYLSNSVTLDHYPTMDDVKSAVYDIYNAQTDEKILSGFVWTPVGGEPINVWLSDENQRNFSEADRKAKDNPEILPITFKIGEDAEKNPVYHVFETYEELDGFYMQAFAFVNQCLNEGWQRKDSIDWSEYEVFFPVTNV